MEEVLVSALKRFDLSEKEVEGIDLDDEDVELSVQDCRGSLVGRIMGDKIANFTGVKNFTNHVWGYPRNLRVTEIGPNVFQFQFEKEVERERVLRGGPWIMDNQVLVIREWSAGFEKKIECFRFSPLWIQIWNLPTHWMSSAAGVKIGRVFRNVKDVILPPGGGKEGKHMKILAEIDLLQPLIRGTTVKLNGEVVWVEFKYERCPDFCYKCGIIGHGDKVCKLEMNLNQTHREAQFGPWMRAGNIMFSPIREGTGKEMVVKIHTTGQGEGRVESYRTMEGLDTGKQTERKGITEGGGKDRK
ncbi:uncharacterized protein LOC113752002 [Coffea eugenioides]|uniref:uncharacterized protein LOC113752002 n=1 Tax=Coffea eugenioides TaxID=49369 RepID=UPI000F6051A1|nr:uncharacterized protein LOC113752002 [Coffea eugenioides]